MGLLGARVGCGERQHAAHLKLRSRMKYVPCTGIDPDRCHRSESHARASIPPEPRHGPRMERNVRVAVARPKRLTCAPCQKFTGSASLKRVWLCIWDM